MAGASRARRSLALPARVGSSSFSNGGIKQVRGLLALLASKWSRSVSNDWIESGSSVTRQRAEWGDPGPFLTAGSNQVRVSLALLAW